MKQYFTQGRFRDSARLCERISGCVLLVLIALCAESAMAQTSLYYSFPIAHSTNWTTYSLPLAENGWTVGATSGPPASADQLKSVLGSLGAMYFQFHGSNVVVGIDNVSLAGLATSTFDGCSDEGWHASWGPTSLCIDGNPPACILSGIEPVVVFQAPGKFLGDKSASYSGTLALDVKPFVSPPDFVANGTVELVSSPDPAQTGHLGAFEWGLNYFGTAAVPPGLTNLIQVAAGDYLSLALREDGTVASWGWNGGNAIYLPPGLSNVIAVAGGGRQSLALKKDGTVVEWAPVMPTGLSNVVAIAGTPLESLALRSDGTVVGWRVDFVSGIANPVSGLSNVVAIAGGATNYALKADGSVVAWTPAWTRSAEDAGHFQTNLPAGLTNVTAIADGGSHFLALKADGTVLALGNNSHGESSVPPTLTHVVQIAAGNDFSVALRSDGTVIAWGDDTWNQTDVPADLTNVVAISASGEHTLALVGNGPPATNVTLGNADCNTNGFAVSLPTQCGHVYALEYKNALTDPKWIPLPLVAGTGKSVTLRDTRVLGVQRFYRVGRW